MPAFYHNERASGNTHSGIGLRRNTKPLAVGGGPTAQETRRMLYGQKVDRRLRQERIFGQLIAIDLRPKASTAFPCSASADGKRHEKLRYTKKR